MQPASRAQQRHTQIPTVTWGENHEQVCGLWAHTGCPGFNQRILGSMEDWKKSILTAEERNYLSHFLCIFSYCRERGYNLWTGPNRLLLHTLVFHFGPTQYFKQNHLPSFLCAAYPVDFVPGHCVLSKPTGYPETPCTVLIKTCVCFQCCSTPPHPTLHPIPTTMEKGFRSF